MKINLLEDEISGNIEDGSINLNAEIKQKILDICTELFRYDKPVIPQDILGPSIQRGRIELNLREDIELKCRIICYMKPDVDFVIPIDIAAKSYLFVVNQINQFAPELLSYSHNILDMFNVSFYDVDFFFENGIFTIDNFFQGDDENYIREHFRKQISLVDFLTKTEETYNNYVLPHPIKFSDDFTERLRHEYKKLITIAKAYQQGIFEGHSYKFESYRLHISPDTTSYDLDKKHMTGQKFYKTLSYHRFHYDGNPADNYLKSSWKDLNVDNEINDYHERLIRRLRQQLEPGKIQVY